MSEPTFALTTHAELNTEINRLTAENERLRGALKSIAFGLPEPQSLRKCRDIAQEALSGETK